MYFSCFFIYAVFRIFLEKIVWCSFVLLQFRYWFSACLNLELISVLGYDCVYSGFFFLLHRANYYFLLAMWIIQPCWLLSSNVCSVQWDYFGCQIACLAWRFTLMVIFLSWWLSTWYAKYWCFVVLMVECLEYEVLEDYNMVSWKSRDLHVSGILVIK